MKKNDLLQWGSTIIRVLEIQSDKVFIIDCRKRNIPTWVLISEIQDYTQISEMDLHKFVPVQLPDMATIDSKSRCIINERYTMISEILPFVSDFRKRNKLLATISAQKHICRQTLINYLCLYLAFQNKAVLAPKTYISDTTLSSDEKNYRWALNKFFYNQNKNSLKTACTTFFESAMQLARRSVGLQYSAMSYDNYFKSFCKVLFDYQFVAHKSKLTDNIIEWLYEHSAGVASIVVSLIHDGQEIAILNGKETLDMDMLNAAYEQRLSLIHGYIEPSIQKGKSTSNTKTKNKAVPMVQAGIDDKISISILAKKSKSEGIDIVPLLKEYFQIVEVTI